MTQSSFASLSSRVSDWRNDFHGCWPGLLMSVVIAIASTFIAEHRGGPTLLYALLLGMALNTVAGEGRAKPGVDFAARRILRLGVALLGARITFEQIGGLGWFNGGLMVAGVVVTIAFGIARGEGARALAPPRRPDRRRDGHLRRVGGDRDRDHPAARRDAPSAS